MQQTIIDIVLPCYNPIDGWVKTIIDRTNDLSERLPQFAFRYTIVNDGSSKGVSPADVDKLKAAIPSLSWISYKTNRGKGFALRKGIETTTSEIVIYTDIDLPYTTESMARCILSVAETGNDLSIAVRNTSYYDRLPTGRRILSKALRNMNKAVLRLKTADTQGGLKVFSQRAKAHFMSTTIDRYLFDLEFVYLCSRDAETTVDPIESDMRDTIEFSKVPLKVIRAEGWNFLKLLMK